MMCIVFILRRYFEMTGIQATSYGENPHLISDFYSPQNSEDLLCKIFIYRYKGHVDHEWIY